MAYTFKNISAKPTFGTFKQDMCQSDYINRKKRINTGCKSAYSQPKKVISSYDKMYSDNLGVNLDKCNNINKSNLIAGQYSNLNLTDVITVSDIANMSDPEQTSGMPFYFNHIIDPHGQLFGKSQCGELNYTQYMVFNCPIYIRK